ncbi:hypothetical protein [Caldisalinibacter kiritimatiensis]|uniref:Uncharacterized protein n=1 Tax=Caldisalinibacter kiritimatiensis TaxID=1304284 RepID=R1CU87_9FIRM|nr:hypothetical protein [Caldisalinibacter kiritimatiensis]EOD00244.1 hypothetical protein L21TH_1718 [Caldisalinibacter kiritimatiensis]
MKKILTIGLTLLICISTFGQASFATSDTRTDDIPQLNGTIRSDVWIQTIADPDGTGEFQVTADYDSSTYPSPSWIKTEWDFYVIGISASIDFKPGSGSIEGSGYTSTSGGYWKNSNGASMAWYRGRVGANGLTIYVGCENTASGYAAGVPFSTTARV